MLPPTSRAAVVVSPAGPPEASAGSRCSLAFRDRQLILPFPRHQGSAVLFQLALNVGDDLGVLGAKVKAFAGIIRQVEQQRGIVLLRGLLAVTGVSDEVRLVRPFAHSVNLIAVVIDHQVALAGAFAT